MQKTNNVKFICNNCGLPFKKSVMCSLCQEIFYCSVACQKKDLPEHKKECSDLNVGLKVISQREIKNCFSNPSFSDLLPILVYNLQKGGFLPLCLVTKLSKVDEYKCHIRTMPDDLNSMPEDSRVLVKGRKSITAIYVDDLINPDPDATKSSRLIYSFSDEECEKASLLDICDQMDMKLLLSIGVTITVTGGEYEGCLLKYGNC